MKLATVFACLVVRSSAAFQQGSGERFSSSLSSSSTSEDRWAVVQERIRIADQGDTGAPANLYWRQKGQMSTPPRTVSAKPKAASAAEDRWDLIHKHIFLADQGDCGPPPNLYWGTKGRSLDLNVAADLTMCTTVDRWGAVQQHIFMADEGDTGALPNLYWGANTPRTSPSTQTTVDQRAMSHEDRWSKVEKRIFMADAGDCGVPSNLYWRQQKASTVSSSSAPSLPPAQETGVPLPAATSNMIETISYEYSSVSVARSVDYS